MRVEHHRPAVHARKSARGGPESPPSTLEVPVFDALPAWSAWDRRRVGWRVGRSGSDVVGSIAASRRVANISAMRISQTGIRSARPITTFAVSVGRSREAHLGLRRGASSRVAQVSGRPTAGATLASLHTAARSLTTTPRNPSKGRGRVSTSDLHRVDAVNWSQPTNSGSHRPRPRSAAPWRG